MGQADLQAVAAGGQHRVIEFFQGMSEQERRKLSTHAFAIYKQAEKIYFNTAVSRQSRASMHISLESAACALFATAVPSEMERLRWRAWDELSAVRVLADRSPPWLHEWLDHELAARSAVWSFAKRMVDAGLCPPPTCDNWVLGFIIGDSGHSRRFDKQPLAETIASDPRLQDILWRLFEVEGTQEISLAQHDKYSKSNAWAVAVTTLAEDGRLPRERLLDASLAALTRDFAQFRAGWFSALHEKLKPNPEERRQRRHVYLGLLASRIPPTVSFAVEALTIIDKNGGMDDAILLDHIEPALGARSKKTVLAALKLVGRAVKRSPTLAKKLRMLQVCLAHEAQEVQAAALDLLESTAGLDDKAIAEIVRQGADLLAPSLRRRADRWVGSKEEDGKALAGHAPALVVDIAPPARSRDEAIDILSIAIERLDPVHDIERALDGVSRFCHERDDDFDLKTGPLLKRARKLLAARDAGKPMTGKDPRLDLCALAVSWITASEPPEIGAGASIYQLLSRRIREVALRALRGEGRALLALPTHPSGWIDGATLVDRAQAGDADWLDAIQALLRLRPDEAVAASPAARVVPGEFGCALRYALGATPEPPFMEPSIWLAAHRARFPTQDASFFAADGPDGAKAARYTRRLGLDREYRYLMPALEVQPSVPKRVVPAHLPVLLHCLENGEEAERPSVHRARIRWAATVWPASLEPLFASRMGAAAARWYSSGWGPEAADAAYFESILHSEAPLGPASLFGVSLGLETSDKAIGVFAVDVLIRCLDCARLDASQLGEELGLLIGSGGASLGRVARRLGEVAAYSPLLAGYVRDAIEAALPAMGDSPTNDISHLLSLLNELCAASNLAVRSPAARSVLETLKGGKRARLAAELLGR